MRARREILSASSRAFRFLAQMRPGTAAARQAHVTAPPLVPGDLVRIRGARWRVARQTPYEEATVVEVRGCDRANRGERAHFLLPFEGLERLPLSPLPLVVSRRRWRHTARRVLASATPAYHALDSAAAADLDVLPFQLEPALAVTNGLGSRLLIADDVGLGKTVQAGLVIAEILRRCPGDARALVVCPAGLREQWQSELRARFRLESTVLDSSTIAGRAARSCGTNPWAAHRIVVTSIDYVKRPEVLRSLEPLVWDVGVFDEAHTLAGRSDRRSAAAALADRSRTVVMLTATPHSGDDEAFARLVALGSLDGTFPLLTFRRTRDDAGLSVPRRTRWCRVRLAPPEVLMHRALSGYVRLVWNGNGATTPGARLAMTVLTRRACSSATSLARSVERRLALLAGPTAVDEQLALPFSLRDDDDAEPAVQLATPGLADRALEQRLLEQLRALALQAASDESKIRTLRRLLHRARQPAIVFTEYRDTLVHLASRLAGFGPAMLHGGLTPVERRQVIRQFTGGDVDLLLATDAASEGLNLHQRCRLVVNLELPWTPLRLEQRIGRVDRIGQRRRVHAVHLLAADTSEETTVAVLCRRMEHAGRVLDAIRGVHAHDVGILQSIVEGTEREAGVTADPVQLPAGCALPDVRDAAREEARRIVECRRLGAGTPEPEHGRPAVRIVRRGTRPAESYWILRTAYVDGRDRHVWESIGGVGTTVLRLPIRSSAGVCRWFRDGWNALALVLEPRTEADRAALERSVRRALTPAAARERAILAALDARRARMAAALVQPGLFDRRSERAASAQAAIVEEAIARCAARLADIAGARAVTASRRDLVCAVVFD